MAGHDMLDIRPAGVEDSGLILAFIRELADYERLLHEVVATEAALRKTLFGPQPQARVLIAEYGGHATGFALFHGMYSTFTTRPGIYVEDLYVRPPWRGRGIGKALLRHVARLALKEGCCRLDWSVLNWNAAAMRFYSGIGARPLADWTRFRLEGDALGALASGEPLPATG